MKYTNTKLLNLLTIVTCFPWLYSCCGTSFFHKKDTNMSPMYKLYTSIEYNDEQELLLVTSDKSYVFRAKWMGLEIGTWERKYDSLFLFPQVYVYDDNKRCEFYNGFPFEYSTDTSLVSYFVPYRLYICCGEDKIKDYTLEHHHLTEKGIWYIVENEPLQDRNIKATKKEKK